MPKEKLYRNEDDAMFAGVLSGFAHYFGQDVVLWRLGFVVFLILTGLMPGVLLYVVAWIIMPLWPTIEPLSKDSYVVFE